MRAADAKDPDVPTDEGGWRVDEPAPEEGGRHAQPGPVDRARGKVEDLRDREDGPRT